MIRTDNHKDMNNEKFSTEQDAQYWRHRRLSPAQVQVHDVRLEGWRADTESPMIEMKEVLSSTLDLASRDKLTERITRLETLTSNRSEQSQIEALAGEYGWMNCLRSDSVQQTIFDPPELRKCRWIHISSKFSDNLLGCLLALSDWNQHPSRILSSIRQLEHCIHQNERFSKHGRYFAPFFQELDNEQDDTKSNDDAPIFLSVPFLDWGVDGRPPPLRFQIDPREGYQSSKSASHLLRSILQHYYRLEDTTDREPMQVFTKHKPWQMDRGLDLKVRRWYGQYPSSLNVDELWILVIDSRHCLTFSSNQSWKSRWPPLQLASRIAEVSFRGIRNSFLHSVHDQDYTSSIHIIASLNAALGMLHRSFWTDLTLCLSDRYASYLSHLQYRLTRSPSTRLVMDLIQVQDELNIIIQIMSQQIELVTNLQNIFDGKTGRRRANSQGSGKTYHHRVNETLPVPDRPTFRQYSLSHLSDPISQLLENLNREFADLCDLRDNSNTLINRTIQLVNIRLEDHGKAILVFTIVTIIFLPLSFITSFFGMNTSDIRNMTSTQSLFWTVAASLTVGTVAFAIFLAFYGSALMDWFVTWRENRRRRAKPEHVPIHPERGISSGFKSFKVLDVARPGRFGNRFGGS